MYDNETTTIRVREGTRIKIRNHGRCGESFDAVINRIFDEFDKHEETGQ